MLTSPVLNLQTAPDYTMGTQRIYNDPLHLQACWILVLEDRIEMCLLFFAFMFCFKTIFFTSQHCLLCEFFTIQTKNTEMQYMNTAKCRW